MRIAVPILLAAALAPAHTNGPKPEITRDAVQPQPVGAVHTLRQIPEACARIEGAFTGDPAEPYRFAVVRTRANCQPRARFVDAAKVRPAQSDGWVFNDLLRVPSAECASQQAVVRVWRKPVAQDIELDAQGRSRIYLDDATRAAAEGRLAAIPMFAAEMGVEGKACGR